MNAPTRKPDPFTAANNQLRREARCMAEVRRIERFAKLAQAWADQVTRTGQPSDEDAMFREVDVLRMACQVWDDGDLAEALSIRCDELKIDEEGHPLDANGWPLDRDTAQRVMLSDGSTEWRA